MTARIHKLTAGDGYTYLVRQVAAGDSTELGRSSLGDYYLEKGESPGRWRGNGLVGLGPLSAGDRVTEAQMKALFGEGVHPDADPESPAKDARLGRKFNVYGAEPNEFVVGVARRCQEWSKEHGQRRDDPIPAEVRAEIRTEVGRETYRAMHGRDPLDERELSGHIARMSRPKNQAVAGFDMTFAPAKSVAALWAVAPRAVSEAIAAAHTAAVDASIRWVEAEVAFTRRGRDGVRQTDITGLITAQFVHRDSRASDPHLHTHVAISNKVQAVEDGAWLALDGAALYRATVAASERYDTVLETELAARLGVEFATVPSRTGPAAPREIVGVDPALSAHWSSRHRDIDTKRGELASAFQRAHGRPPTPQEAVCIDAQAWAETRDAKHEPRALADQRAAWRAQAVEVLGSEQAIDAMVERAVNIGVEPANQLTADRADELAKRVVRTVEAKRAQFHSTHVIAEAQRVVRAESLAPDLVQPAVDHIVGRVLGDLALPLSRPDTIREPEALRRRDGTSVYERAHSKLFSTAEIVAAEASIVAAARMDGGRFADPETVELQLTQAHANGTELNPGQAAMVREIALSGKRVQLVLAPAGSGKTTALGVFSAAWEESGGHVMGLAPSAVAAHELRSATGGNADTIASLTWALETGRPLPEWAGEVGARTVLVVDEAGMAGTRDLARVVEFALERGASVRLVGDDQQLASISAGGVLRDIAAEVGAVTLSQLMRFDDKSEAAATLAVRDGQASALGFYLDRGRVHVHDESTLAAEAFERWHADHAAGLDSLMMAFTHEVVDELNGRARMARLDGAAAGREVALKSGLSASSGDTIVTRKNDRKLRVSPTDWVKNGDRWTVREVHEDGSLTAHHLGSKRVLRLPAEYVAESVDLGYASTIHSVQGMTVLDNSYTVLSGTENRQLLYVALSRARNANHILLSTGGDGDSHKVLTPEHVIPPTAVDRLERILATDGSQQSARTALREAADPAVELARVAAIYRDAVGRGCEVWVGTERLEAFATAAEGVFEGLSEAPAWETLRAHMAVLEASGIDAMAALRRAADGRELGSAHDPAAVLDWRLDPTTRHSQGVGPLPWLPAIPAALAADEAWGTYLTARSDQVVLAAMAVAERAVSMPEEELPVWSHLLADDRPLVADVAVWRAARGVPDSDERVLDAPRDSAEAAYLESLRVRVHLDERAVGAQWREVLDARAPAVLSDPWWPVLGRRLDMAQRAQVDVPKLLRESLARPLPDEHPAAALWYRMAGTLAPVTALSGVGSRLRPSWAPVLVDALPEGVGARVMRDAEWPSLVAAVEGLRAEGGDPAALLADAAALLGADRIGQPDGVPLSEVAITMSWRVRDLTGAHGGPVITEADVDDPEFAEWLAATADERHVEAPVTGPVVADWHEVEPPVDDEGPDVHEAQPEPQEGTSRARIVELHELAAGFYASVYTGSGAARYIAARFAGDDLSADPRVTVGYAPAGWTALTDHLQGQGASTDELVDAGLSRLSSRGTPIDVFRDRVVFGLRDASGDLVGFSGRAAPGAEAGTPKYLNTPTTAAFSKGEVLFGLAENRDALAKGATPARAEGVLDALAITKASDGQVVGLAPLGTALTQAQAEAIATAALANPNPDRKGLVLDATDTDTAGTKAGLRDYWSLTAAGADVRRLVLLDFTEADTAPKDPADLYVRDAGQSLGRVLSAPEVAPTLAGQLVAAKIASDRHVEDQSAVGTVHLARGVAGILAALPPEQWDEHVQAAAALIVDRWQVADVPGETAYVAGLLAAETVAAGVNWDPVKPPEYVSETSQRIAALRVRLGMDGPVADAARTLEDDLTRQPEWAGRRPEDAPYVAPDQGWGIER